VKLWIHVDDDTIPCPEWAVPYEDAAESKADRTVAPWGRSGDDLILIYTGGTTGQPKGVMWRQHDLYRASDTARDPAGMDLEHVRARITAADSRPVGMPASPLMHGTGFVFAGTILTRGGTVVTATSRRLDVVELLDVVSRHRVSALSIVGDAFCRPIVETLDDQPGRWDLSSVTAVSSSGMMWSPELKDRLLAHAPNALLVDFLNSSEASGMGRAVTSNRKRGSSGRFRLGENSFVIDEHGTPVEPGSGQVGRLAMHGILPLGYYKDPDKTAATFPVINGVRCSVPGDYARVEADGSITLLGRGSTSINTGGEKVFPEEVEEALKTHLAVTDAVVVGVPDTRFGNAVAAMVAVCDGADVTPDILIEHVRGRLARYKAPRHVMLVDSVLRGPNGKADYPAIRGRVEEWLSEPTAVGVAGNHLSGNVTTMSHILFEKRDGLAYVTLNRPEKRNALTPEMVIRLAGIWEDVAADDSIRAVLLTGAGDQAFSSGGDLGSLIPIMMRSRPPADPWEEQLAARRSYLSAAMLRNDTFYKPIVAAVNGPALAGGAELLLATDIRVASTHATFALTEVRRGLIAGGGSLVRLARQVPWTGAMEIALVGEPIDAETALRIGLFNRVVPPEDVLPTAERLALSIARGAPVALSKSKEAIVRSNGRPLAEAFAIETECTIANAKTADAKEGPRAFMEKRDPVFLGR
jgi:enoyl-CoA hydratase/carnithine racemase/acyl-CoA synthetase (AMP-forming)/AMP-acid ligase II